MQESLLQTLQNILRQVILSLTQLSWNSIDEYFENKFLLNSPVSTIFTVNVNVSIARFFLVLTDQISTILIIKLLKCAHYQEWGIGEENLSMHLCDSFSNNRKNDNKFNTFLGFFSNLDLI